jgi:predicted anti-sigma-YlaC factor YlaD
MASQYANVCDEFRALASSHLDGELEELELARLERHLGVCARCTTWSREAAALAALLHEATAVQLTWWPEGSVRALRTRLVRAASVGAAAISAAAVAGFAITQAGHGLFLLSTGGARSVAEAPCASCMKEEIFMSAWRHRPQFPKVAVAPVRHVSNPFVEPDVTVERP